MRRTILALVVAACAVGPVFASDASDALKVVHQYVDDFNKGDVKSANAACADQAVIVDDFPPHIWDGAGACAKWANDFDAMNKKTQLTDVVVSLGKARHADVTGDRAYVVMPASLSFKQAGKPTQETGSVWTFVLQKTGGAWRITAWAWGAGKESAAKS
jgi:ketosteroid isomerase-like protein